MRAVLLLNKPVGMTPLQAINGYRKIHPEFKDIKLGYAGRLDPMAEGLLLVLVDRENKQKVLYEKLDKTYEVQVLFGIATDTYDSLGIITKHAQCVHLFHKNISHLLQQFVGTQDQYVPPFSSKRINGKPLFAWARQGQLPKELPTKRITISAVSMYAQNTIMLLALQTMVFNRIDMIVGNFRQHEIRASWKEYFKVASADLPVISLRVTASSGTYMRSLAHDIGTLLDIPTLALTIRRTRIGQYDISQSVNVIKAVSRLVKT